MLPAKPGGRGLAGDRRRGGAEPLFADVRRTGEAEIRCSTGRWPFVDGRLRTRDGAACAEASRAAARPHRRGRRSSSDASGDELRAGGEVRDRLPRRIYVTDCEGPLTRNDNAMELADRFLPGGAGLFARLSRYDDFLADVLHKPGYNAGDTLRLLPPFLVAFGLPDEQVVRGPAPRNVLVVPGAPDMLAELQELLPCFIVSTSYTPYIRALCEVVRFPFANCAAPT